MRKNILICTHEISPYQGSECAEGWNIVIELSKYHNLYVLYAKGSQYNPSSYEKAICDYLSNNKLEYPIVFIAVRQPTLTLILSKINKFLNPNNLSIGNPFIYFFGYRLWQFHAYKKATKLIYIHKIDLVHLLTSITFREPGYLWKLGLPYVWGPTGGLSSLPKSYKLSLNKIDKFKENIREYVSLYQFKFNKRIKNALKFSSLIYTFSEYDRIKFMEAGARNIKNLTDSGSFFMNHEVNYNNKKITILWAGQLIKRKAFNILLNSIINLPTNYKNNILINVVGDGHLFKSYNEDILNNNLTEIFIFHGQVSRDELFDIMKNSDLLIHTSYREATTNIIPEALSHNLPIICHDIGGMSIVVNDSCGYKIPLINPLYSSNKLTEFLIKLCTHPDILLKMKISAKQRSSEISWASLAEKISKDYNLILNQ